MWKVKRVYEPPKATDGFRILVDRLWPRGLSKEKAAIQLWLREVAPSNALRKWYGHDPAKWPEFQRRYRQELAAKKDLIRQLRAAEKERGTVTLLFSSREERHNNAVALKKLLAR
jgi:uncharacterized protein YeaO (DUF488 family)